MTPVKQDSVVELLLGDETIVCRPVMPFDALICAFLDDLNSELRKSKEAVVFPDVMSFAFWCRKSNIGKLKKKHANDEVRIGVGNVFHITPSNVPVNFAFSFVFGLLSGNANVVRVPSKDFPQTGIICGAIDRVLADERYVRIKESNAFVRYERGGVATDEFSRDCNARIIWGGDLAIREIRKSPVPERCVEIAFADRYSFCVMDAPSVLALDEHGLQRLGEWFYNDTYLMDQNACSSPHLLVWLGRDKESAQKRFWQAVFTQVNQKYKLAPITAVDKFTLFCQNAVDLDNVDRFSKHENLVYRMKINSLPEDLDSLRGRCGYFYEFDTDDINSVAHAVNAKFQTLTYFGVEKSELANFVVKNCLLGIDRIVPVGQALDIGLVWDGYDVVRTLSRIVDVR